MSFRNALCYKWMEKRMSKIIVIDNGNFMFRAIFSSRNNPSTPATYLYMRMIIGCLKKVKATFDDTVIMACDYGKSWRKTIDQTYKAQRKQKREEVEEKEWWDNIFKEFNEFFPRVDISCPWHFVKLYTIESDDIAAVSCRYYKDKEVILLSSDKDWEMLCFYNNVKIFSPISKKFKEVKHPMKILLEKIQGDISDNLLDKPSSEAEFEKRKKIVNLLELPNFVENPIIEELQKILPKKLFINKVPYHTVKLALKELYEI